MKVKYLSAIALALLIAPAAQASEELAKKYSKDPGSGANGGDLDFAKAEAYVPEFGQALTQLKKGEMTLVPVKTQFGWHIIKLEDTREAEFPAFDDVKAPLMAQARQNALLEGRRKEVDAVLKDARYHTEVLESLVVRPPGGATR